MFSAGSSEPVVEGRVVAVQPHQVPAPTSQERAWRAVRSWVWPAFLVIGVITGSWWPTWMLVMVVFIVAGKRVTQLQRERQANLLR